MVLTEHDDVVEELAAHVADPALGDAALPRAPVRCPRRLDADTISLDSSALLHEAYLRLVGGQTAYPRVAKVHGSGSTDEASTFVCAGAAPAPPP